ncbi:MAG: hypothetical protein QM640_13525 [Niabella sp.]
MFSKKHTGISLRFRQWRRKSYAAFQSIGRHVTIGKVKSIVADTLLRKQKDAEAGKYLFPSFSFEYIFEETDDPPEEQQLLQLSPVFYQQKEYYGRAKQSIVFLFSRWLKATIGVAFSHFYFRSFIAGRRQRAFIISY